MEMEIQRTNESRGGASLHGGARLPPVHFPDRAAGSPPAELPRPDRSSSCSSPISSSTSRCNPYGAPAVPCRTDPPWPTAVVVRLRSAIIDEEKNYKSALPKCHMTTKVLLLSPLDSYVLREKPAKVPRVLQCIHDSSMNM
jgi:hypothetical protein